MTAPQDSGEEARPRPVVVTIAAGTRSLPVDRRSVSASWPSEGSDQRTMTGGRSALLKPPAPGKVFTPGRIHFARVVLGFAAGRLCFDRLRNGSRCYPLRRSLSPGRRPAPGYGAGWEGSPSCSLFRCPWDLPSSGSPDDVRGASVPAGPPAGAAPYSVRLERYQGLVGCDGQNLGQLPIYPGQPGFQPKFDGNNDGVGCE